jgi:hypothetical protein
MSIFQTYANKRGLDQALQVLKQRKLHQEVNSWHGSQTELAFCCMYRISYVSYT